MPDAVQDILKVVVERDSTRIEATAVVACDHGANVNGKYGRKRARYMNGNGAVRQHQENAQATACSQITM
jgi:hypothetical protein